MLAAVAGYVDAYVFLRVTRVFIANQSGNLIVGGMSAVGGKVGDVVLPFVSVLAYIAGAAAAAALFDRPGATGPSAPRRHGRRRHRRAGRSGTRPSRSPARATTPVRGHRW